MPREKNFTSSIPTVHLLGELERFGGPFRYSAKTPKECADALCATVRGFRKAAMQQAEYQILVNGKEVDSESLLAILPSNAQVEFVPVIGGRGNYGEIVQERWGNDRLRWEEWFKQAAQLGVPA